MRTTLLVCLLVSNLASAERQFKSQAEYDIYSEVNKDLAANNFAKAWSGLEAWKQKFPDSDYKDDRAALTVQALANQPAKAVDAAADLLSTNLSQSLSGPAQIVKFLYTVASSIQRVPDPTAAQIVTGRKAARLLQDFTQAPGGVTPEQWTEVRRDMTAVATGALLYTALVPAVQALNKKDCAGSETAARKAQEEFPRSGQAAWSLASALLCQQKIHPESAPEAIYEFARAASLDPKSAMVDPKWQQSTAEPYLEKIYAQYHGEDPDGLKQLKTLAIESPQPPAGFELKTAAQIVIDKNAAFDKANPELALWMDIKAALKDASGQQYFESSLKDTAVPPLKGRIVEARPQCRPKELMIAIEDQTAEILLKLDKPFTGKPEVPAELTWQGVPTAFSASPFLLTMEVESQKLEGLKAAPCAPAKK